MRPTVIFRSSTDLKSRQEEQWIRTGSPNFLPGNEPDPVPRWHTWTLDPNRDIVLHEVRSGYPTAPATLRQEMTLAECRAQLRKSLRDERRGYWALQGRLTPTTPLWDRAALEHRISLWWERFLTPIETALSTATWDEF